MRESIEYIFTLHEIIGQDFQETNSLTIELYSHWKYAIKSLILLH